jgi:hypothetical protein
MKQDKTKTESIRLRKHEWKAEKLKKNPNWRNRYESWDRDRNEVTRTE